ncbi:MAG TPA: DEAD/DEAH box helicase, partial [Sphingomonas sp.]|nr:DEAD/DEAH box helicase [Sphingomonas sp.]
MPVAEVAARLAPAQGDIVYVAVDEQRAEAVAGVLRAFAPDDLVLHMPSSDALPGDDAPPSPANVGRRVAALRRLRARNSGLRARAVLVTSAEATAVRYPAPGAFDAAPPEVAIGDAFDADAFAARIAAVGYFTDDRVDEPGEVAVRGHVVDIFPADLTQPMRIEIADGRVEAIRCYDPVTQRGDAQVERVELGHASEPPVEEGGVPLLAHMPGAAVACDPGVVARRDRFLAIVADGAQRGRGRDAGVDGKAWTAAVKDHPHLDLTPGDAPPPRFVEGRSPTRAFAKAARATLDGGRLLLAGTPRDLRFLVPRLGKAVGGFAAVASLREALAADAGTAMTLAAPVDRGFAIDGLTIVAAADLLGARAGGDTGGASAHAFGESGELQRGDVVVHEDFGIGVIVGLEATEEGSEAIVLRYAKDARRLVPVAEADRIWRYGADDDAVTLDTLDGASWQKRRGDIAAAIRDSATSLAKLAAEHAALKVAPTVPDTAAYERFAACFGFTETPDQARAIAAVRADLASGAPMDRLVIGDVGYGKTEVALRAAALVALAGGQVAVAAPTTVLVRQHIETFARRFEGTGIAVAGLSRLSSSTEKTRVKAGLADGSIGVVVGTGAVAGKSVAYADLRLVVIDEEQRFGAADKARLHGLGIGHVLTLSATPIPRTLQTALVGLQDVSVIATPPARRQPIRTSVAEWEDGAVRAALLRERARGGQSFVVVPRVSDMAPLTQTLARLVPELTVRADLASGAPM